MNTQSKRRVWPWVVAVLLVVGLAMGLLYRPFVEDRLAYWLHATPLKQQMRPKGQAMTEQAFVPGERVLIIAPHPDDETLGGGGVIEKAKAAGKQVRVVVVTSGDGYAKAASEALHVAQPAAQDYRRLGEIRHQESANAMKQFGVEEKDLVFLGYPDGGVNGLWELNWDRTNLHKGLNGAVRSPYSFAYEPNAPYCGDNVVKNLTKIVQEFKPTDVVYPDPNDQHHDHWATHAFVKYVLTQMGYQGKEWTFLVHRGDFPVPWVYKPTAPLLPPEALQHLDTHWIDFPMSAQEAELKHQAILQYKSQIKVMDPFLEAFVRRNELLGTYADPVLPTKPEKANLWEDASVLAFHDAYGDTVQREVDPGADIMAYGAVKDGERLIVGLEAKAAIAPHVTYHVRGRIFEATGVRRFDWTVENGKLASLSLASNSIGVPPGAAVHVSDNRIWLTLPVSLVANAKGLMISTDTRDKHDKQHAVDKTAWRLMWIGK